MGRSGRTTETTRAWRSRPQRPQIEVGTCGRTTTRERCPNAATRRQASRQRHSGKQRHTAATCAAQRMSQALRLVGNVCHPPLDCAAAAAARGAATGRQAAVAAARQLHCCTLYAVTASSCCHVLLVTPTTYQRETRQGYSAKSASAPSACRRTRLAAAIPRGCTHCCSGLCCSVLVPLSKWRAVL